MSDVIDFLERLGRDATLREMPLATALDEAGGTGLSAEVRAALVASRDQQALEGLLGSKNVCCMVHTPMEEERAPEPRKARDQRSLEAVLGVSNVCCLVHAPTEQEETDVPVKKDAARAA